MTSPLTEPAEAKNPGLAEHVDAFKGAMRLLACGVTIITAGKGEARRGVTVSAVCSVTLEPPTLLVCLNRAGETYKAIRDAGSFCVNLLSSEDEAAALCFAGQTERLGADQFVPFSWIALATGAPALQSALANVDCDICDMIDKGTHAVIFGAVRAVRVADQASAPGAGLASGSASGPASGLVYFNRQFNAVPPISPLSDRRDKNGH